jgi:hypothetical protein
VLVSLYLRALVPMSSFSKSLRRDLKIFLGDSPVFSAISWRVSSLPSFRAAITSSSVLFNFIFGDSSRVLFVACALVGCLSLLMPL